MPSVDGLDGVALQLTARERQLVDLAASGLSNADIGDRLVLSVRTAETHARPAPAPSVAGGAYEAP